MQILAPTRMQDKDGGEERLSTQNHLQRRSWRCTFRDVSLPPHLMAVLNIRAGAICRKQCMKEEGRADCKQIPPGFPLSYLNCGQQPSEVQPGASHHHSHHLPPLPLLE